MTADKGFKVKFWGVRGDLPQMGQPGYREFQA
jgi:hypothetical protein